MNIKDDYIYLDHAAATPMDSRVLDAMMPYFSKYFFNPSSPYSAAVFTKRDYESAKARIAKCIGAKSDELIITAGATESINLAINSVEGHAICSTIEHKSVIEAVKKHKSYDFVSVDKNGVILLNELKDKINDSTVIVSIALANNEIGTIEPISEVADIIKTVRINRLKNNNKTPIYLHCDASQGCGLIDMHVSRLGADMMTANAAKIYGPKQVGLLWASNFVKLKPQIVGGGQENGLRSGTENVAGTIGYAMAIELAMKHMKTESKRLKRLRNILRDELTRQFSQVIVSGNEKVQLPNFLHISFPGIDAERLIFKLESRGVFVATGSACAANQNTRSHVLISIGLSNEVADGSIRISLGKLSNENNIKKAARIISEEVKQEYARVSTR